MAAGGGAKLGRVEGHLLLDRYAYKVRTAAELRDLVGPRPRKRSVIMCHGVFDIVHPGHVRHLLYAKSKASVLIASPELAAAKSGRKAANDAILNHTGGPISYTELQQIDPGAGYNARSTGKSRRARVQAPAVAANTSTETGAVNPSSTSVDTPAPSSASAPPPGEAVNPPPPLPSTNPPPPNAARRDAATSSTCAANTATRVDSGGRR